MDDQTTIMLDKINAKLKERQEIKESYNIFSVLEIENKELIHSRFLAHLINPNGKNQNHQRFFKSFLQKFIENEEQAKFSNVLVKTEQSLKNGLLDLGRADIWIKAKETNDYIIIENKLFAGDQKKQLKRYSDYLKGERSDGKRRSGILIYLTLNGKEASNHSTAYGEIFYYTISYSQISSWINEEMKKEPFSEPFSTILTHYCTTVDKLVMKYEILNIINDNNGFPELLLDCLKNKNTPKNIKVYIEDKKIVELLNAELELKFWKNTEKEIKELPEFIKIHSQRKYSYERVFKRNEKKKIDKEYGLICELNSYIFRISVDKNGKLSIRKGEFDAQDKWKPLENGDLDFDGEFKFTKKSDLETLKNKVVDFLRKNTF